VSSGFNDVTPDTLTVSGVTNGAQDIFQTTPATTTDLALAADRLRRIEAAAEVIVDHTMAANTRRAFAADWQIWTSFCAEQGIPPETVSSGLLVAFATWAATGAPDRDPSAPATITRRLAGVLDGWKRAGQEIPHGISRDARKVIAAYQKQLRQEGLPTGRGASQAITIPDLRAMSATCEDTPRGLRDRALIVIGFSIAARRSVLAAMNFADITDIRDEGLLVHIRDDKTGGRDVAAPYGSDRLTCPVRTWQDWVTASGITSGRAFRSVDRGGRIGAAISGHAVNAMVQERARAAGLTHRTAHSMRSGLATESRRAGKDAKVIAEQGGWKPNSMVLFGYMQIVDRWTDNAAKGIGL
jgi:integrase